MRALISATLSKAGGAVFTLLLVVYLGQMTGSRDSGYFYFTLAVVVMLAVGGVVSAGGWLIMV